MKVNKPEPLISVILLNWNAPKMTIECIKSIYDSSYQNLKVTVVDNNSTDNSIEVIKQEFHQKVEIIVTGSNIGYARGMNKGLEYANNVHKPDFFLIMNNDTVIDVNAMRELVKTSLEFDNKCITTGKVYHYDDRFRLQTTGNYYNDRTLHSVRIGYNELDEGQYDNVVERSMIDDIFMLYPCEIYNKIGGYSKFFFMNYEQEDLILKIKSAGYKSVYTPYAKIWHKGSFSTGGLGNPKMMYWEVKSKIILHRLNQDNFFFYRFLAVYSIRISLSLFKGLFSFLIRRRVNLKARYAQLRGILAGLIWLVKRDIANDYNPID